MTGRLARTVRMVPLASENQARELFLSGGEVRQLFARDTRLPPAAPLIYLPDGEADRFRADCSADHLVCPVPDCPRPHYTAVGGTGRRRHHFRHRASGTGGHAPERWFHLVGKQLLADWARSAIPGTTSALEVWLPEIERRADALATTADGRRFALEVQYAGIDFAEWKSRDDDYRSIDITPVWVFGHLRPHLVRGRGDVRPGEVKITTLFAEIIAAGRGPIHLINPDTRQIARLLVDADIAAVREIDSSVRAPWGWENGLLGVDALADCTLTSAGLESNWDRQVTNARAAVQRQADALLARIRADEEAEQRALAARDARIRAAAARDAARAQQRTEQLNTQRVRVLERAAALRSRVRHLDHPAIAPNGPSLATVPSDGWQLPLYVTEIHGKVGRDLKSWALYGAARKLLPRAEKDDRAHRVTDWIFDLRALQILDFASLGRRIVGPMRVLGDVDHPAAPDVQQHRRAMDIHRQDDHFIAIDRARGVLFTINDNGAVGPQRPLTDTPPTPAPTRPRAGSDAEWKAQQRASRAAHVPGWVTQRLSTDQRVQCPPVDWHRAIWDQHIVDQVGAEKPWGLLMTTLVSYSGRRNVHTEDALLGFLAHLQRHNAVKFQTRSGRLPDTVEITSGAAPIP